MKHVYRWGCGRTATFALFFLLAGLGLAWFHRLDGNFIALCTVIQGMVLARAVSDDHRARRDKWEKPETAAPGSAGLPPGGVQTFAGGTRPEGSPA